jgi:hypothetical protein
LELREQANGEREKEKAADSSRNPPSNAVTQRRRIDKKESFLERGEQNRERNQQQVVFYKRVS